IKSNDESTKILDALGFDPFKNLRSITAAVALAGSEAKVLVITHGQFDKVKFEAKAEDIAKDKPDVLKVFKEGDRKVYQIKTDAADKPVFAVVVDQTTILAGSEKQTVLDAVARGEGKRKGNL